MDFKLVGENLKQIRQEKGLTQKEFSNLLGIKQQALSKYENGDREVSYSIIFSLIQNGVNPNRLFGAPVDTTKNTTATTTVIDTEHLKRIIKEELKNEVEEKIEKKLELVRQDTELELREIRSLKKIIMPGRDFTYIEPSFESLDDAHKKGFTPVYEEVSAGTGCFTYGEINTFIPLPDHYKNLDNIIGFTVKGNSMEPRIPTNSIVVIKENVMPENGQIGIFAYGDEWFVKIYKREEDTLTLKSYNKEYRDIVIDLSKNTKPFKIIGSGLIVISYL